MNDRTLEQKRKELRKEMKAQGFGWIDGKYIKPPKEYEMREKELSCIDMINSILCYNCREYEDAEKVMEYEEKSYHNYLADYVGLFGRRKVINLIQGQIDSIDGVKYAGTDSEGVTYNGIVWKTNSKGELL